MNPSDNAAAFSGLVDLAAAGLGGRALGASDDFFAAADNLLQPGRGVFIDGKFTDRGKWMDGWESRRKRGPGHDWCIVALGAPGEVVGLDIDTHHFVGQPPAVRVGRRDLRRPASPLSDLQGRARLGRSCSTSRRCAPTPRTCSRRDRRGAVSHVRLNIFPDGGVARFRVFGRVHPDWERPVALDEEAAARVAPELRRPGGADERGPRARLLGRVLRADEQPAPARAGGGHGRRLGDAAPPRAGTRLDRDPARRARDARR